MEGKELILHLEGTVGFLTPDKKISLSALGLSGMLSRFRHPAHWIIRVIKANPSQGRLFVEVVSYHSGYKAVSDIQLHNTNLLEYSLIAFKSLDTSCVYASSNATGTTRFTAKPEQQLYSGSGEQSIPANPQSRTPLSFSFTEIFTVDFEKATFLNGRIEFEVHSKIIKRIFTLSIFNDNVLPEFNYVKSWFPKRLCKKVFNASATIEVMDNVVLSYNCTSDEINQITPELIAVIQLQRVLALSAVPKANMEKSLFTLGEALRAVDTGDEAGNVFNQGDINVLHQFLSQPDIRNKRELEYLSGTLHSAQHPLRYTLYPQFGFLFCVEGVFSNHFIWELLNSHATYVWSVERNALSIASQFQLVDREISTIKLYGRQEYRANSRIAVQRGITFTPIHHKPKDSTLDDSFSQWKEELEKHLAG